MFATDMFATDWFSTDWLSKGLHCNTCQQYVKSPIGLKCIYAKFIYTFCKATVGDNYNYRLANLYTPGYKLSSLYTILYTLIFSHLKLIRKLRLVSLIFVVFF
jgi:hypothetical protein